MALDEKLRLRRRGPIGVLTRLPWWTTAALAVLCWLLLRHAAGAQPPFWPWDEPQRLMRLLLAHPAPTIARIGQYLLPLLLVVCAAVSALRRLRRRSLLARVARDAGGAADALDGLSWQQFELLTGEIFRRQGWRVVETGGGGADGGVDLVLRRQGAQWLVQCKHWKSDAVGVAVVRELYGVIAATGAAGGFVVASGRFTEQAVAFSRGLALALIDGVRLRALAREAWAATQAGQRAEPIAAGAAAAQRTSPSFDARSRPTPSCTLCARPMVLRTARRGPNAGRPFWGCTGFPDCRGTQPVD